MARAFKIIVAAMALASLTGCRTWREVPVEIQHDSIFVNTITSVHDTTILWRVPEGAESSILADTDTSRLRTSLAESEAWVHDGKLHHALRNRAGEWIPVIVPMKETVVTRGAEHLKLRTVTVEKERELSWFQKLWIALGKIAAVALALVIIRRIR